jgi:hypothetical protein
MRGLLLILLVAVAIILVINTGICSKKGSSPMEQLNQSKVKTDATSLETKIRNIMHALNLYYSDQGEYPDILDLLIPHYLKTERELLDPWRSKFKIEQDNEMNLILVSPGRDLTWETQDDIRRKI